MDKPIYNLKGGDMISTDHGFGVIIKITSTKYWYQVAIRNDALSGAHDGFEHAISRKEFWNMIENKEKFNNVTIHYTSDMRYRRKRKAIEM